MYNESPTAREVSNNKAKNYYARATLMKIKTVFSTFILCLLGVSASVVAFAKSDPDTNTLDTLPEISLSSDTNVDPTMWDKIAGTTGPNALYLGMATFHFEPGSRDDRWNNNLIAGAYNGYFAGTLVNSFDDRAFAFGIQRDWATQQLSENVTNTVGYRVGLITGYDERMTPIAEYTPVLPFPQVTDDIMWKHVGIELSWCVVTASAGFVYKF